jgi:hypothetical protein
VTAAERSGCWPGDDTTGAYCSCPMTHPILVALLAAVWWGLPGRVQAWFTGHPCWAGDSGE